MKNYLFILSLALASLLVITPFYGNTEPEKTAGRNIPASERDLCATIYPIVVAHHWGPPRHRECDDSGRCVEYFYRPVISLLRQRGADVRVVVYRYDYDTTPNRAQELKDFILKNYVKNRPYIAAWEARHPGKKFKVNIIGHSQGCQDSRYMISNLDMAQYVATWTGLTGESNGTPVADLVMDGYDLIANSNPLYKWAMDLIMKLDDPIEYPDQPALERYLNSVRCLTENYMQNKGPYGPGGPLEGKGYRAAYIPGIYYQNWAAMVKTVPDAWNDLRLQWKFISWKRGNNDLWTPVSSQLHPAEHVANRGVLKGDPSSPGVHHMAFAGSQNHVNPGFDADRFWIDMVAELKKMGY